MEKEMMQENETILQVDNLELWFDNDYDSVKILNGITFEVHKGETLGIVGESGCGKSMTSLSVMLLVQTPPGRIHGSVKLHGIEVLELKKKEMHSIRGNRMSMIFQEPMTSLNPVYTVGDQLMESFRLHQGMNKREAWNHAVEMMKMVKIPEPEQRMREYPYQLSGGMRQRIMIAMALACRPELLIADEPTTALDVTIQAQILDLMRGLQEELGTAIMFITHDLGVVSEMCDRVLVLYCGEVMEEANVDDIFADTKHPYTEGLLSTLPKFGQYGDLPTIPGVVPPSGHFPEGCVFAPRCQYATEQCHGCKPPLVDLGGGHKVRCWRYVQEEGNGCE